ncbi:hypothetical protein PUR34_05470 [Streptomyces sp. JV185]|uniref:hypothetical protein n=1 Tax=Streptomyces sp. JV185 TaxID=858638 RepID=UPI002E792D4C|nr:hypothetical protein [Streptomyces sp. JV185]MEE1767638.1 hypothetical protein [Streptomyces sp. JV185]
MTRTPGVSARLLLWSSAEGKPCYVVGDGTGRVSRLADNIESAQLGMALELLDHADDHQVTSAQLRYVLARMAEVLRDVHRIARSRGERLAASAGDGSSPQV